MDVTGFTIREGNDAPFLRELTTLRLGGCVLAEVRLHDARAATALADVAERLGGRLASIGAGSNILAGDGNLPLVLVKNALEPEIIQLADDGKKTLVRVAGSVKLPVLLGRLAVMDLGGLEGLTGIPGTLGGAVVMNAGSYGQCIADALVAMTVVTENGTVKTVQRADIDFGYRRMSITGHSSWFLVLSAELCLARKEHSIAAALGKECMEKKKSTQPVSAASAGCIFKNPDTVTSAGKLLDEAGFKGKCLGGMLFSEVHANFLVNKGDGTSAQAFELVDMAKNAVKTMFDIELETEVKIWV
jgi:UDP-N-acetylmuramate dehydrogenase